VVPAYDPGVSLVALVQEVAAQVDRVVVVDDGSPGSAAASHLDACDAIGAMVVHHDRNRGIAAALNTGILAALGSTDVDPPVSAVLTLDQDSRVGPTFVADLLAAWAQASEGGLPVGLTAPEHVTGLPSQVTSHHGAVALGRDPIQSGMLLPVATWALVGAFDEDLFIDGVDADYALRCLDAGLLVVLAEGLRLEHRLGAGHEVTVAGRSLTLTRPATFRYYYLARNRSRLVRRYARAHPAWAAGQAVGLAGHLVLSLAVVPDRRARARETWHGLRDAARGVAGRRPGEPADHGR